MTNSQVRSKLLRKYATSGRPKDRLRLVAGVSGSFVDKTFNPEVTMKKKVKKLELNRETVRNLTADDLKKIAGGSTTHECTHPITICNSCHSFCDPTCP